MIKRIVQVMAAGTLALATVGLGVAQAGAPVAGVGATGTCMLVGKAKIKPALTNTGTTSPVVTKFKGKLTCTGPGSGDGANVASGNLSAFITSMNTNTCANLATAGLPAFTATIKWKTKPGTTKLLPTTVNFAATPPGGIVIGTAITINLSGTNAAGTSFAGNAVTASAVTDTTTVAFGTACGAKGVKGFSFTGVNGMSTLTD